MTTTTTHRFLDNGIEWACETLPLRRAVAFELRMLAGAVDDPPERLGLARVVEETLAKGTAKRDARALSDAFDEIGVTRGSWTEREFLRFTSLVLPEYLDRAIELHAEFLRTPTFPQEFVDVAIELGRQELHSIDDDPQALADRLIGRQAYGPILGRHPVGELDTLDRITRDDVTAFWESSFHAGRMQVAIAGPVDPGPVETSLGRHFDGFGSAAQAGRRTLPVEFAAIRKHHEKQTEQVQVCIGLRALPKDHPLHPAQRVILAILSGGMSSRLFTEVREKQGLVYWISAWGEYPRGLGMIFLGASSKVEHCRRTYHTMLREIERLTEDVSQEELQRAIRQIEVSMDIRGDRTRARCSELADDLFQFGRSIAREEKLRQVQSVTLDGIRRYLADSPWRPLSVVTLGPEAIELDGGES